MVLRFVLFAVAAIIALSGTAATDQGDDSYIYSRGELFSIIRNLTPGVDIFSLNRHFKFPADARSTSTFIVDFSHHVQDACDCLVDWGKVADANARGVYLKASQGNTYVDPTLETNLKQLALLKRLDVGIYHFLSSDIDTAKQANTFLAVAKRAGSLQFLPSLDLEWDPGPMREDCPRDAVIVIRKRNGDVTRKCDKWGFVVADNIIKQANQWIDAVKAATGQDVLLYTSDAWLRTRLGKDQRVREIHSKSIWIADYSKSGRASERPQTPRDIVPALWQFTDAASFDNLSPKIAMDTSVFDGNLESLRDQIGVRD